MRKLLFSLFAVTLALSLLLIAPPVQAQDDLALECSSPPDGELLGVLPDAVTLYFNQEVTEAEVTVTNADGTEVQSGEPTLDGMVVSIALDAEAVTADTEYTVAATVNGTEVSVSFTVGANALPLDGELVNDCPADMDMGDMEGDETTDGETDGEMEGDEATDGETDGEMEGDETTDGETDGEMEGDETTDGETDGEMEGDETTDGETDGEAEGEGEGDGADTETQMLEGEVTGVAGDTEFTVGIPAGFGNDVREGYFLFPVTIMAAEGEEEDAEETIDAYVENPDEVREYVIIFTTFTSDDLTSFGLEEDADVPTIIEALIRPDSQPSDPVETTVAGATAYEVTFTNPPPDGSDKAGVFYLVAFEGEETTGYLLIQGSAPTDQWESHAENFQAVVDSISVVEEE